MIEWHCSPFNELTVHTLYSLLKIRCDVFVVEQACAYPELDDLDTHPSTLHLYATHQNQPIAYARVLAPDVSYPSHSSIGRVLVIQEYRQEKLGHTLIQQAIKTTLETWPQQPIKIGAQSRLAHFYQAQGFKTVSPPYMEDGIEHISMVLDPALAGE